jgi:hypothetical protein
MTHSGLLVIERNEQYTSLSLLQTQTLMITMNIQHIVLTPMLQTLWHIPLTPPDLATEVVAANSHPIASHTLSGFNILKNRGAKYLLRENRRN